VGLEGWFTVVVLMVMLALLALDRLPPSLVVMGATITFMLTGVISRAEAFAGFANPAPITVAALYVLAFAAQKTGLLSPAVTRLLGDGKGWLALTRLTVPVASASAFVNNTPLVAMLIPDVVSWARRKKVSASRFLMPVSYAAILGGLITLIGTSTNLVVSGLMEEATGEPFSLFEITPIGLPVAVAGLAVMIALIGRLVPERRSVAEVEIFREFTVTMEVVGGGPLDGVTIADGGLRDLNAVFLVEVVRDGRVIAPVAPDTELEADDRLVFAGKVDQIVDLQRAPGLRSAEYPHYLAVDSPGHTFYEAVVGRSSPLVGQTLKEADFRSRFQAAVVAIHRAGEEVSAKLGQVELRPGDTLLVLAGPDFKRDWGDGHTFLLIARLGGPPPTATRRAPLVGLLGAAVILLSAFEIMDILDASLIAIAILLFTRTLTPTDVRNSIDIDVIVLIGAAFGMGSAMVNSGVAQIIADGMVDAFDGFGDFGIVLGLVVATAAVTELITNNAAAAIMFPIALGIAAATGLDSRGLALAVAVAASASFLTPIGYQTNMMVYGPGGYRFTDYTRIGIPMNVVVMPLMVWCVLAFW
jgi:di/tricarboxylate transporter